MSDAPDDEDLPCRSELARDIANLKNSIIETLAKRERVPQPMFWSVFSSKLDELKEAKQLQRVLNEKFRGF